MMLLVQLLVGNRSSAENGLLLRRRGASALPRLVAGHWCFPVLDVGRRRRFFHLRHQLRVQRRRRCPRHARR